VTYRHIGTGRGTRASSALAFAAVLALAASGSAGAKPRNPDPPAKPETRVAPPRTGVPQPLPLLNRDDRLPEGYQDLVRRR
jgi:hypothetical protein